MNKKIVFILILVLIATLLSCKSTPEPFVEPEPVAPPPPAKPVPVGLILDGAQNYVVVERDTLSSVAKKFYNEGKTGLKGYYFPVIRYASDGVADNPDLIEPGEVLVIPDININLKDPTGRVKMYEILLEAIEFYDARGDEYTSHRLHELIRASIDDMHAVPPTAKNYPAAEGVPVFVPLAGAGIPLTFAEVPSDAPATNQVQAASPY